MLRSTLYFPPNASFALLGMRCSPLIFTLLLHLCTDYRAGRNICGRYVLLRSAEVYYALRADVWDEPILSSGHARL
ncbi:hypothetical protein ANCDUO_17530 [Ancylostoma duodenale]|uniref:Uncharacterized protein n=1 Tax=Ancylostoma duodenale TaxID=51022 RepID=A0A0C2G5P4_9BILA|nr:hypothetical protein ANCDUO_17530 [Ancylostoma duodenale]